MSTVRFILGKIVIVEVMLIVLYFATVTFNIHINIVDLIITTGLKYLTPIAVIAFIPYIILSILGERVVEIIVGVVLGGLILYYIFNYLKVI